MYNVANFLTLKVTLYLLLSFHVSDTATIFSKPLELQQLVN